MYNTIAEIRSKILEKYQAQQFVIDKTGIKAVELIGASFLADSPAIFGSPNQEYIQREIEWYKSQSLNVGDIPGKTPQIWQIISDNDGNIHSNYGYLVWNKNNGEQYKKCLHELIHNAYSRRAIMIYTRPEIQDEYDSNGMSDFICTNAVQYLIRDGQCHAVVQMRSNDVWAGYRNDYAWQKYLLDCLISDYNASMPHKFQHVSSGNIIWNVGSLHLYAKQFYLLDYYAATGKHDISKKEYDEWQKM